jgi:hypothetical protein
MKDCVWDGLDYLTEISCLKIHYPTSQRLFCGILGVKDMDIDTLVVEVRLIQTSTQLQHISKLFVEMSKRLCDVSPTEVSSSVRNLRSYRIFPIRIKGDEQGFNDLGSGKSSENWFIADRHHLRDSFYGVVPLLAFNIDEIKEMEHLIQALGFEARKLSHVAKSKPEPKGYVFLRIDYSISLGSKVGLIKWYSSFQFLPRKSAASHHH